MNEKIIIALDVDDLQEAKNLIDILSKALYFKVGFRPFLKFGDELIKYLKDKGKKLFLDLKFKDIPNTVFGAVLSSLKYSPDMLTIHISGGGEMIRQAIAAARGGRNLRILGVTVLTSMSEEELNSIGVNLSPQEAVLKLCQLGLDNGLDSFVCSPLEISMLKTRFGNKISLITPGIRPKWSVKGDQKRVFTPKEAIDAGCDFMVIGRPVIRNKNPEMAFEKILQEIS
jgi:orotidine-5'-phosphate decarboxylase